MRYVAFLRGINVGGNKKVPMADLRTMFEDLGFQEVSTLLNSGNVLFSGKKTGETALVKKIETAFQKRFGFQSRIVLRTLDEIQKMVAHNPFKDIRTGKDVRLYVTFLSTPSKSTLRIPYTSPDGDFDIIEATAHELFSVLTLMSARSVNAMAFIEQEFGREVTTRNWTTVLKIAERG